jgi:hypothetical protein
VSGAENLGFELMTNSISDASVSHLSTRRIERLFRLLSSNPTPQATVDRLSLALRTSDGWYALVVRQGGKAWRAYVYNRDGKFHATAGTGAVFPGENFRTAFSEGRGDELLAALSRACGIKDELGDRSEH